MGGGGGGGGKGDTSNVLLAVQIFVSGHYGVLSKNNYISVLFPSKQVKHYCSNQASCSPQETRLQLASSEQRQ